MVDDSQAPSDGNRAIRVLIVDDQPAVRRGLHLRLSLEPEVEVIGEAGDGAAAISLAGSLRPDVVLMDVRMPEMDGLEATRAIKRECPTTGVLMVTSHEDPEYMLGAVRAGAAGYVLKEATRQELLGTVRRVLDGEFPFDHEHAMRLLRRLAELPPGQQGGCVDLLTPSREPSEEWGEQEKKGEPSPLDALTPREVEVFRLMSGGHTNQQIAKDLFVSVSTVKKHVRQVLAKLGVSDRTQAALRAVEMGLGPKQAR